ncbi:MAG TPA: hypothetical protein VFF29_05360 [Bacteroidota bacterium]|nr:hypothetical protein [Bacteroidota bacterium]
MKHNAAVFFFSILLASCAASLPYPIDYPLTRETFQSYDGVLRGQVPQGWFVSAGDSLVPDLLVWLIKEDYTTTITIRELKLNGLSEQYVRQKGLSVLANLSYSLLSDKSLTDSHKLDITEFKMGDKEFCSYEIKDAGNQRRIVLFTIGGKYYECEARFLKGKLSETERLRLFTIQQSVLSSMIF